MSFNLEVSECDTEARLSLLMHYGIRDAELT